MRSPGELSSLFRQRGLKVTPQRMCIFDTIYGNAVHPTAEAVFAEARRHMPTLALKTVYQTLNDLTEMGEIQQLDLGTGASRFDPNVDDHHHLVCVACGRVRDFYAEVPAIAMPDTTAEGFSCSSAEVVFRGLCASCDVVA
jgi:Fur family peroxide stress response transcriptional regulator